MNPLNPKIEKGKYALIQVDAKTGTVLTVDGQWYTGTGERFLFFDTDVAAQEFARKLVATKSDIECIVHNDANEQVMVIESS